MQGTGNDFVVIDSASADLENINLCEMSKRMCSRHFGIGSDGVILVLPSDKADYKMRIFNPDGSEAETCGNGIRCFTRYIYEKNDNKKDIISVETLAGIKIPAVMLENEKIANIEVDMGESILEALNEKIVVLGEEFTVNKISMGNPHCVIFVENLADVDIQKFGPIIENLPEFPNRTNVEFVQILKKNEMFLKVWERGAGETLACGTGACAAVAASFANKLTDKKAVVHLPGGDLEIEIDDDCHLILRGDAVRVFEGNFIFENDLPSKQTA